MRQSRTSADEGFDPEFGARPLRRAIQRLVETELSRKVLAGELGPGNRVTIDAGEGGLRFDVAEGDAAVEEPSGEGDRSEAAPVAADG